LNHDRGYCERW